MTAEYEKSIVDAAARTWDAIGFDILQASGIPSTSGKCLKRDVVIEVVLDHVRSICHSTDFTEFNLQDYDTKIKLIGKAFPYEEYGY